MILAAMLLGAASAWGQSSSPVAGGVVSSKEWRVKRTPEKEEEFLGEVRYRTGSNVVRSDWALYKHAPQTWQLRGTIQLERRLESGDLVEAAGDRAFLDQRSRSGWMTAEERVAFKRTPADSLPDLARARRLDWSGREKISLTGEVHVWGPRLECWSDRADYADASAELTLGGGRPVLVKFPGWAADDDWSGAVKADEIRAWHARRRLSADGQVRGWLEFTGPKGLKGRR